MDFKQSTTVLKNFCQGIEEQISSLIVILHNDKVWINKIYQGFHDKGKLKIFTDKAQFHDFIKINAFSKLFVDISNHDHLTLIRDLSPIHYSGELYFTSDLDPDEEQIMIIHKMGGEFIDKHKALENILAGGVNNADEH